MSNLSYNITAAIFNGIRETPEGGTFHVGGRTLPTRGYYVGGAVKPLVNPRPAHVLELVETAPSDYVGYWRDSSTGEYHIDAVDHVYTLEGAFRLGSLRKEIAVWDIENEREIRIKYPTPVAVPALV